MQEKQQMQDDEYSFPYHYIPQFDKDFTQTINWEFGMKYAATIELLLQKISRINAKNMADIGCGDGRLVREMSKAFPKRSVTGIDYSQKAITLAQALNPQLNFICEDITAKKAQGTYDLLTLIEVFEHIPLDDAPAFVQALSKQLKKGGRLIMTVPHKNKKLQEKHYQHFTGKTLTSYFKEDFIVEELVFFEKRSISYGIKSKLLTNGLFILNNQRLKNCIYKKYKKATITNEKRCGRIYLQLKKK